MQNLKEINDKLDFLIAMQARVMPVRDVLGGEKMQTVPGEALFKEWKIRRDAKKVGKESNPDKNV